MTRHNTTPLPVLVPSGSVPAGERRDVLGRWWRQVTSIVAGLVALGTLGWVVGKAFFVSREEYVQSQQSAVRIEGRLERIEQAVQEGRAERAEVLRALGDINLKLVRFEKNNDGQKTR